MNSQNQIFRRIARFIRGSNDPDDVRAFNKVFHDFEKSDKPEFIDSLTESERKAYEDKLFAGIRQSIMNRENQTSRKVERSIVYSPWFRVAASVVILLVSGITLLQLFPQWAERLTTVEHTVLPGSRAEITLSDGTLVSLNGGSTISYRRWFLGDTRKITLTGEAFFKVKRDEEKPFVVLSGEVSTAVLGTSFNIKAYPDLDHTTVSVATGKVEIRKEEQQLSTLTANQEIIVDENSGKHHVNLSVDMGARLAWKEGKLVFDNYTMREVATLLHNYYKVEIIFTDSTLKNTPITGKFEPGTALEKVLKSMSYIKHFEYEIANGKVILKTGNSERKENW